MSGYQNKVGGAVTRVQDTFNRGTLNPSGVARWVTLPLNILPYVNPLTLGLATCPNNGTIVLTAQANGGGSNGTYLTTILPCIGLTYSKLNGQPQYCQSTFQGFGGGTNFTACGNMINATWDGINGTAQWYGVVHRNNGLTAVEKASVIGNLLGNTILFTDIAPVVGDVWRLSFNPITLTLTATKNGVVVFTTVDSVSPVLGGIPGLNLRSVSQNVGVNGSVALSNLDCGLGL